MSAEPSTIAECVVNKPHHYTAGGIEVFDFIKAWNLDFPTGNIIKYVMRSPYKGKRLEDLRKAKWYLEQLIEAEQKAQNEGRVIDKLQKLASEVRPNPSFPPPPYNRV